MQRLFDMKKTQLEMLFDRGYNIRPELEIIYNGPITTETEALRNLTLDQFIIWLEHRMQTQQTSARGALSRAYEMSFDPRQRVLVMYVRKEKDKVEVSVTAINAFRENLLQYRLNHGILVADAELSSKSKEVLATLRRTNNIRIEEFKESDLLYNPTHHVDVPIHERLTSEEAQAKLLEMKTSVTQLPLMRLHDPIAKYYGYAPGDIIRIHRDDIGISVLASKSINYRVVID